MIIFAGKEKRMKNPFIITGKIPPAYFCDRRVETQKIIRSLTGGDNICLMSPRRMGKSKLVQFCYDQPELKGDYYAFYIDILHTSSLAEFTYLFGQEVFNLLRSTSEKLLLTFVQGLKSLNAKFGFDPFSNLPSFSVELGDIVRPEYTLQEIFDWLEQADKPCLVAFDEFQQISRYPEKHIEALLRSHIQHLSNVHFIFAGSERHLISEMFLSSAKPFYNSTKQLELLPIAPDVYAPFVCGWFQMFEKTIQAEDVLAVYDLYEGNTYCMQRTFHEAFAVTGEGESCDRRLIRRVIDEILEDNGHAYARMLSLLPIRQKEVLYAIAREGRAEKVQSSAFIKKHSLQSASSVQGALRKLLESDFITFEEGSYKVSDKFFQMYLLRLQQSERIFL